MALSYPLALPTSATFSAVTIRARSSVGISMSPFSFAQTVYANQGMMWEADIRLPPMQRAVAEEWVAFLLALNGREGTFLMSPDPVNTSPRGTWAGTPQVMGASQTGRSLIVDTFDGGATGLAGDWFQLGTGSDSQLYKLVQSFTADGTGIVTLEIWPNLRSAPANNSLLNLSAPKGVFRLASSVREWSLEVAQVYGIQFSAMEAIG